MTRHRANAKMVIALILLGLLCLSFASLGRWQLRRAEERRTIAAKIEAGRTGPAIRIAEDTAVESLTPWQRVEVEGHWLPNLSLLLDNRNQDGRPGFWLATPLQLEGDRAILVLRGWFPREILFDMTHSGDASAQGRVALQGVLNDQGQQRVIGEIAEHVPRLFELWHFGSAARHSGLPDGWPVAAEAAEPKVDLSLLPKLQNIQVEALEAKTGLHLMTKVLMQTDASTDGLVRQWPKPSTNSDQNNGYAVQWFGFALIALIAWVVIAYKAVRRGRNKTEIGDNN